VASPEVGQWQISVEADRIDICLWRVEPASVVVIENKSNWALDQEEQLYRYWHKAIHTWRKGLDYEDESTKAHFKIVYLVPTKDKQPTKQSLRRPANLDHEKDLPEEVPLGYVTFTLNEDMPDWFRDCSELLDVKNERLRVCLQMYHEIWSRNL
jgi:PD-(D/E)XK nuclease superfamily